VTGFCRVAIAVLVANVALAHTDAPAVKSSPIQTDASGFVYVVNPDADTVTKLTPLSGGIQDVLWEMPVGDHPRTLTLAGGSLYTADQGSDSVTRLATGDGASMGSVDLGFGCAPFGVAANQDATRVYVSCQGTQELVVLDAGLGVVARVALDWPVPRAVLVSGDDTRVWVSHFLTVEPSHDGHVSEIDAVQNTLTARGTLTLPLDRSTCETQNSGQGVTNLINSLALPPPGSPPAIANQLWVGGILQNNLTKGLFRRHTGFRGMPQVGLFDLPCPNDPGVACMFESFPRGNADAAKKRNVFKTSFHDVIRFVIWKVDLGSGEVVGKIDIDEASQATDMTFSADGTIAYVVDQMFHSYHVFNTLRGQDGNAATLYRPVSRFGPFGAQPNEPCVADALGSVSSEAPFRLDPQVQIAPIETGDPIKVFAASPTVGTPVETGVDFDTRLYHESGTAAMRDVPDAVGTAPTGVALSPDGCVAYVANYLARNVVAVSAKSDGNCGSYDPVVGFVCSGDLTQSCQTTNDCSGGPACTQDSDCETEPCVRDNRCIPLVASDVPARTTALVTDEVPAEILDGKILFNTAARDASVPNGVGLDLAAPLFNDVRRGCGYEIGRECRSDLNCSFCADTDPTAIPRPATCVTDADCGGVRCVLADNFCSNDPSIDCGVDADCPGATCVSASCDQVASLPGELVSTSHDASYVTCTTCHADYGGQDGRTWDFSQFGASLRNTMDLRGRSQAQPGTCKADLSADAGRVGMDCTFDAACGTGSAPGACGFDPGDDTKFPPHLSAEERTRYFNPMLTVHWNGDRMEVEGFEFTYRSLLGAADCDGFEHAPDGCLGALVPRSTLISTAAIPFNDGYEADMQRTLRNVMIYEPTLDKEVNASIRLSHVADFVYSLTEFPRNPFLGADGASPSAAAERGRLIFNDESTGCASCHNGPTSSRQLFTDKRPNPGYDPGAPPRGDGNNPYVRHAVGTENIFDETDPDAVAALDGARQNSILPLPAPRGGLDAYVTPVLNDIWNTPPFLHDGSAPTLLDVVRSCRSSQADCDAPGMGRNVDEAHGKTAHLTPQQLNDLVAFQNAPHNPVGSTGSTIQAGTLTLSKLVVNFGKKPGKGKFKVKGIVEAGTSGIGSAGGLSLTLAVPGGGQMDFIEVAADAADVKVKGDGKKIKYKAKDPTPEIGKIKVSLKRRKSGDYKLVASGKKADLATLQNGATDLTVALVVGDMQFVENRLLTEKKNGRVLALGK
jgi:DNA-binding beta-propeller fold protein YncE